VVWLLSEFFASVSREEVDEEEGEEEEEADEEEEEEELQYVVTPKRSPAHVIVIEVAAFFGRTNIGYKRPLILKNYNKQSLLNKQIKWNEVKPCIMPG
jgi:hypothetical protein